MSASDVVAGRVSAPRHHGREGLVYPLAVLALAGAYYGAAQLVFWLEVGGPVAAVVWLPAGVAIAALYLGGNRLWPGVLVADLLVNDYGALGLGTALAQTCGNMAEILVAATLLRRAARRAPLLDSIEGLMAMLWALAAGVTISATVGTLAQLAGDVIATSDAATVWRTWWLGDFTGALVLVPLAIAWSRASGVSRVARCWSRSSSSAPSPPRATTRCCTCCSPRSSGRRCGSARTARRSRSPWSRASRSGTHRTSPARSCSPTSSPTCSARSCSSRSPR
jgi:hypothetical protein